MQPSQGRPNLAPARTGPCRFTQVAPGHNPRMADFYATRVPYRSALDMPGRARHPIAKIFLTLVALVAFVVLLAVGLVVLIVDIILLPIRLLLRLF